MSHHQPQWSDNNSCFNFESGESSPFGNWFWPIMTPPDPHPPPLLPIMHLDGNNGPNSSPNSTLLDIGRPNYELMTEESSPTDNVHIYTPLAEESSCSFKSAVSSGSGAQLESFRHEEPMEDEATNSSTLTTMSEEQVVVFGQEIIKERQLLADAVQLVKARYSDLKMEHDRLSKEAMSLGLSHLAEKLGIDKLSSAAEGIVSKYCRN